MRSCPINWLMDKPELTVDSVLGVGRGSSGAELADAEDVANGGDVTVMESNSPGQFVVVPAVKLCFLNDAPPGDEYSRGLM